MIGTQIGSYRVVEKLAEGGMGEVFIARHELMRRDAVVKVLLPQMSANHEIVERFLNEARAVNQIHHAGIVEIFDLGFLPSGQAYIVMERLRGESLADRLRRGPLSVPQTVAFARQLASALGAAHAVGIVHRDLKPDNLFLCPDQSVKDPIVDGGERLKVLDFGIAKVAQGEGSLKTAAGAVFGTPPYMSPEQCASAGEVDARSDLYAVGCILFEVLCGRPPFGQGGIELIAAQIRDAPPTPRTLNPAIPEQLETVLLGLLEKQPARRPQSCTALIALLGSSPAATRDLPPTLMPVGSVPPSSMAPDGSISSAGPRRRPLMLAMAVAGLGLFAVVGYLLVRGHDSKAALVGGPVGDAVEEVAEASLAVVLAPDEDGVQRLFTIVPGKPPHSIASTEGLAITSAAVSPGGRAVAIAAVDAAMPDAHTLHLLVPERGDQTIRVASVPGNGTTTIGAVSDRGDVIVINAGDKLIVLRDGVVERSIEPTSLGGVLSYGIALSADGSKLAFSTMDASCRTKAVTCSVVLWAVDLRIAGAPSAIARPAGRTAYDPQFITPDGAELIYMTNDGDDSAPCQVHFNSCRYAVHQVRFDGSDDRIRHDDAVIARQSRDGVIAFRRKADAAQSSVFTGTQALMVAEPSAAPRRVGTMAMGTDIWSPDSRWLLVNERSGADGLRASAIFGRDGDQMGARIAARGLRALGWITRPLPVGEHTLERELPPIDRTFADDFARDAPGRNYRSQSSAYRIVDGVLTVHGAQNQPLWLARKLPTGDLQIDLDVWSTSADGDLKVEVWSPGPALGRGGYMFIFGGWKNQKSVIARENENGTDTVQRTTPLVEPNRRYHWRIVRHGNTIDWYIDDMNTPFLTYTDPKILGGIGREYLGFNNWESDVRFDNLTIKVP